LQSCILVSPVLHTSGGVPHAFSVHAHPPVSVQVHVLQSFGIVSPGLHALGGAAASPHVSAVHAHLPSPAHLQVLHPSGSEAVSPVLAHGFPSSAALTLPRGVVVAPHPANSAAPHIPAITTHHLPIDPSTALVILNETARRYPLGILQQEREALLVSALAATGQKDEASSPRSRSCGPFRTARMRLACGRRSGSRAPSPRRRDPLSSKYI